VKQYGDPNCFVESRSNSAQKNLSASGQESVPATASRGRVWDVPVRVSHWLLAACIAAAWLTREARLVDLHALAGYCALALLIFRIAWGFIGTTHARFADFRYSPRDVLSYLRAAFHGRAHHYTGHNPAGSWAVYGLLLLIAATLATGLAALAGMHAMGPLPASMAHESAEFARAWHEILAWALLTLILLHVAGALWGSWLHRENLVAAMISGLKKRRRDAAPEPPPRRGVALALACALTAFSALYLRASGWTDDYREQRARARAHAAPAPTTWNRECGGCHLAFSPALLPALSWQRMLEEQADHFGEDLSLRDEVLAELRREASLPPPSWAAWKLASTSRGEAAPQRITDSPFWRHAHRDLGEEAFRSPVSSGKPDCEACHADAASGIFRPRLIQIPRKRFAP
jgi:cytochrome b